MQGMHNTKKRGFSTPCHLTAQSGTAAESQAGLHEALECPPAGPIPSVPLLVTAQLSHVKGFYG